MASATSQIGPAYAATPFEVAGWSEDEARSQFKQFRWAEFGGRPTCGKCGCDAVNAYKARPIYKCKGCFAQFSDTSGTPWAYRKLKFRKLMYVVAMIAHNVQAKTVADICRDISVQYKTAFLWVQKLRSAIAQQAEKEILAGEVEIDGAYFGGFVRPKNLKKKRTDLRKIPFRDNERALSVTAARQRDGSIRTWVSKNETDARPFIADAIEPGSILFTDKAPGWSRLRGQFDLRQIDHSVAFYTPEACTNAVETLWALMRVMVRTHRHICQNYLDLYAAEAAWTLTKGKKARGQAFGEVMSWMSRAGRSPLAGYFQGRKRSLALCRPDNTTTAWVPKPRSGKTVFINEKTNQPVPFAARKPRRIAWRDDFIFMPAGEFLAGTDQVPDGPGVYALFISDEEDLVRAAGFVDEELPLWREGGASHVYTGETYGLRSRLLQHLSGTLKGSNLRETLLALHHALNRLATETSAEKENERAQAEAQLSQWLAEHAVIGFKTCGYVKDVEVAILKATASPLNLARPNPTAFTRRVSGLLDRFRNDVGSGWPNPPLAHRHYRR